MSGNNTCYERNKECLQENYQESAIVIMRYKKWNLYYEIWDGKLNDKGLVNKMFLMTKMKLYLDKMREKIQLLLSYQ